MNRIFYGPSRPRFRTLVKHRVKPFIVVSMIFLMFSFFQNFSRVDSVESPFVNPQKGSTDFNQEIVFDSVSDARVYQTSDGSFNVIKGAAAAAGEVDYLSELDVSGKNCIRLAQMATQTGQHLKIVGLRAKGHVKNVILLQKVFDCAVQPQSDKTASR